MHLLYTASSKKVHLLFYESSFYILLLLYYLDLHCIIHLSEGALLLYYMYILYFTPTWRYLAIVLLYCIGLYTYLRGPCFYTIMYYIVQDTYLRGPCYCPGDWRRRQALPFSPAVQTVLLHPLSKYEIKIKYTSYM